MPDKISRFNVPVVWNDRIQDSPLAKATMVESNGEVMITMKASGENAKMIIDIFTNDYAPIALSFVAVPVKNHKKE